MMEIAVGPIDPLRVYTPDETARLLGLGRSTVLKIARKGNLRAVRCGAKVIRFYGKDIIAWVEAGGMNEPVNAIPDQIRRRPRPSQLRKI